MFSPKQIFVAVVEWIQALICKFITGPLGAITLALLATVISVLSGYLFPGVLAVLKLHAIENTKLWESLSGLELLLHFFALIVIFILFFGLREHLVKSDVVKERDKLYRTIRSMPPIGIMVRFWHLYRGATNYIAKFTKSEEYDNKSPDEKLAALDDSIRLCTDALSSLAFAFQRDDKARFAANVMTYHPIDMLREDSDKEAVLSLLGDLIDNYSFDGLQGYLMLDKSLTSSTTDPENSFAVDELAENFALPIPDSIYSRHNSNLLRLLPGAPYALYFGEYIVDDTHKIKSAIRAQCDLPVSIGDNIHKYFTETKAGKAVRSFVSLSILRFNDEAKELEAIGTANVHCDKVKLFANDDIARSFMALSQPFLDLIAKLLIRRNELQ